MGQQAFADYFFAGCENRNKWKSFPFQVICPSTAEPKTKFKHKDKMDTYCFGQHQDFTSNSCSSNGYHGDFSVEPHSVRGRLAHVFKT